MDKRIINTIVNRCLGYKRGEKLLIVCDYDTHELAVDFYNGARELGIESVFIEMVPRRMHGEEVPETVANALYATDLALLMTSKSMSHTKARKKASKVYGARIASMPGVSKGIMGRSILIDYSLLHRKSVRLARLLTEGKRIEIYTEIGTSLVMSIDNRSGFTDDGLYTKRGAFGNLPAGEACISPVEGTANGRLVVDGSCPLTGKLKSPIEVIIKDGYAKNVPLSEMKSLRKKLGRCVFNVAELGIGLNTKALVTGNVLEDEKACGTAHIGFGNNISFGGGVDCPSHLDFVFKNPVILIDDKRV